MSVSRKSGEIYYTDEELEMAKRNNNALKYALSRGYILIKTGNEYRLKEHDSMVFKPDGKWYWNSKGLKGRALDFIQCYENFGYKEAVCLLAGTLNKPEPIGPVISKPLPPPEKKEFILPKRSENYKILFAYLIKERGIDADLVKCLVHEKKLYQSKAYNNVVMVGYDEKGIARYASMRSTNSYTKTFKIDVPGSDKSYPFVIDGSKDNDTVCVFESPIEAMSYWSLCKETESNRINCQMISLGGAGTQLALDRFLKDNPKIKNIVIGLNNDSKEFGHSINAGRNGTEKIKQTYGEKYHITTHQPHLNDWNDVLKNYRKYLEPMKKHIDCPKQKISRISKPKKNMEMAI